MKIYNVVHRDRHFDIEVTPFSKAEDAIDFAKDSVIKLRGLTKQSGTALNPSMIKAGWVYYECYSDDGDYIYIQEKEVK